MISEKKIREIRVHLENAQNPLFFFDDDGDGLCSFLLLRRYRGSGKGVAVKGSSSLGKQYFRKVNELNPDYIFILDKPKVDAEFFKEVEKVNLPVVWIDHHEPIQQIPDFVNYYNSFSKPRKKKSEKGLNIDTETFGEPVTFISYMVSQRKEDLWLAVVGCISDRFVPPFYSEFERIYPELSVSRRSKLRDPFDILYCSGIGRVAQILNFALMARTSDVVRLMKYMISCKNPYEVLNENPKNRFFHKRFREIERKLEGFLKRAKKVAKGSGKVVFFKYKSEESISSLLANRLSYFFPNKLIVVAREKGGNLSISLRGKGISLILKEVLKGLENGEGGGHLDACGAKILEKDWETFKKLFEEALKKHHRKSLERALEK